MKIATNVLYLIHLRKSFWGVCRKICGRKLHLLYYFKWIWLYIKYTKFINNQLRHNFLLLSNAVFNFWCKLHDIATTFTSYYLVGTTLYYSISYELWFVTYAVYELTETVSFNSKFEQFIVLPVTKTKREKKRLKKIAFYEKCLKIVLFFVSVFVEKIVCNKWDRKICYFY